MSQDFEENKTKVQRKLIFKCGRKEKKKLLEKPLQQLVEFVFVSVRRIFEAL
jgi:hypothetical protein